MSKARFKQTNYQFFDYVGVWLKVPKGALQTQINMSFKNIFSSLNFITLNTKRTQKSKKNMKRPFSLLYQNFCFVYSCSFAFKNFETFFPKRIFQVV